MEDELAAHRDWGRFAKMQGLTAVTNCEQARAYWQARDEYEEGPPSTGPTVAVDRSAPTTTVPQQAPLVEKVYDGNAFASAPTVMVRIWDGLNTTDPKIVLRARPELSALTV